MIPTNFPTSENYMTNNTEIWTPPLSFEEQLKKWLVPASLYIRYKTWKELRRGEKEIAMLPFLVRQNSIALDIGANKGVWSFQLSKLCPKVHAFEPNPKMYAVLAHCAPDNVETHPVALSNETGTSKMYIPKRSNGSYSNQGASLSTVIAEKDHQEINVETRKLDDYEFENIGFIKIDVEGFEMSVLEGAKETLARCHPILIIEMEELHTKRTLNDLVNEVESYGYEGFFLDGDVLTKFTPHYKGNHVDNRGDYLFNFIFLPK